MKKLFHRLWQKYNNMKLLSKMTFVLILSGCVPLLIMGFFFYGQLYDMVVSYTIRQEQDVSAKTSPLIEETVQDVLDISNELTTLPFYKTLFQHPINHPLSTVAASSQALDFQTSVHELTENSLISAIRIYVDFPNEKSDLFHHVNTQDIFSPVSMIRGTYWYGIFQGSHVNELHCPSFYLGAQEQTDNSDTAYIRKTSLRYYGDVLNCYVAVYYSSDILTQILAENLQLDGSVSYIMNERNALVASSNNSLSGIYWLDYETIRESFMSSNNFIERMILGQKVYAGFYSINQPGWFMVTILPSGPLITVSNNMMLQYVVLYLCFLFMAALLAALLARSITGRISSVTKQMRLVRQGPPVSLDMPSCHDEVGDLIETYNYMSQKMNQLIADQGKAAEDLRIAEFHSLQAQINPHFLYNTMDMINWLAQQGRTDEVQNAVQNLSRFYKLTLSRKQSISTIAQEEEHVSIYVHLQNMRFHDSIEFISDIPDELSEYQIPKLTLQPVIENAILHGILEKDSKSGTIVLTGWMEGNDLVLMISDDGVGIPQEKLKSILSGTENASGRGNSIAVYNTHRRLQILYGNEYGLAYTSLPGHGTEVQIRIPAQKEYENPYVHIGQASNGDRTFLPAAAFSNINGVSSSGTISPETMLDYSQKLTQNLYNIQNLHQVFQNFSQDENLYILTHEVSKDFPNHTHDHFELNYVCSGSLINVIDGNEVYMSAGDLLFLNRKAIHSLRAQQSGTLLINFCLKPSLFDRTLKAFFKEHNLISDFLMERQDTKSNYMFFSLGHSLHAQSILTSIIQEYAKNGFHQSFSLEAWFLLLFTYLVNAKEYSYDGIDSQTHSMILYLQEHCLTESLDSIAAHFQFSIQQMEHHLKTRTGRSCHSYIEEVQLDRAVKLLVNPNLNLYQIAEECGYTDAETFFRAFRQKFHISPVDYRKQFM